VESFVPNVKFDLLELDPRNSSMEWSGPLATDPRDKDRGARGLRLGREFMTRVQEFVFVPSLEQSAKILTHTSL
jgi:hypothetical protein